MKIKGRTMLLFAFVLAHALLFAACGASEEEDVKTYSYNAGQFVTNVKDSKQMLSCAITIDVISESLEKSLAERGHVVQDTIVRRLRQLTEEDLTAPDIEDTLSESLVAALNGAMNTQGFYRVYFVRFVYQ